MRYWNKTLRFYRITPSELNALRRELIIAQRFKCAICCADLSRRKAFLDHEHHSGAIRGILCFNCNRFRVAKNTTDTAVEVVRYLANPPAHAILAELILKVQYPDTYQGSV